MSPALDACPGVLALHPARDGLVARIRLPGGYATAPRWRALADLSRDFGDGCVDVTARGNVQLRGLRAADGPALAACAAAAGLMPSAQHDRARNIMASPLSGLDGRPPLRALVEALDAALLAGPEFAALPGRFLFALDDGTGGASLATCDIGLSYVAGPATCDIGLSYVAGPATCDIGLSYLAAGPASPSPASGDRVLGAPPSADPASGSFDLIVAGRHVGVRVRRADVVPTVLTVAREALALGVGATVTRIAALPDGGAAVAAAVGGTLGAPAASDVRLPLGVASPARPAGPASSASSAGCASPASSAGCASPASSAGPPSPASPASLASRANAGGAADVCEAAGAFEATEAVEASGVSRRRHTDPASLTGVEAAADFHDRDRLGAVFAPKTVTIMGNAPSGHALVVAAPLGRLTGEQIEVITGLIPRGEVIRVGVAGRLVIPLAPAADRGPADRAAADPAPTGQAAADRPPGTGSAEWVPAAAADVAVRPSAGAALARLAAAGLTVAAGDPMGDVTACSGAACHRSLADVRAAAGPVADYQKTHWAGCSRLCGCPPDAEPVVALDATRYRMPGEGGA